MIILSIRQPVNSTISFPRELDVYPSSFLQMVNSAACKGQSEGHRKKTNKQKKVHLEFIPAMSYVLISPFSPSQTASWTLNPAQAVLVEQNTQMFSRKTALGKRQNFSEQVSVQPPTSLTHQGFSSFLSLYFAWKVRLHPVAFIRTKGAMLNLQCAGEPCLSSTSSLITSQNPTHKYIC